MDSYLFYLDRDVDGLLRRFLVNYARCSHINRRWDGGDGVVCLHIVCKRTNSPTLILISTITYDTLVRAGVDCTSAFVSDQQHVEGVATHTTNPPFSKGSRGINILPDTYLSLQMATTVRG